MNSPLSIAAEEARTNNKPQVNVFFVCSGLGHVSRGFESFTEECFRALRHAPSLSLTLYQGAGISERGRKSLWCLKRAGIFARSISVVSGKSPYYLEQVSFGVSLLPFIVFKRPDIIFFSDGTLGNLLWHFRRRSGLSYRLLFSNGAPFPGPYLRADYVQQLAPSHSDTATAHGTPPSRQVTIPYGINTAPRILPFSDEEKNLRRRRLGLPEGQKILLSVGALKTSHKRMDYVIREVAAMGAPRPFLLLLGESDFETREILALASTLLGVDGFAARTVPAAEMNAFYHASDAFVLASLHEGLARVLLEAAAAGLPCIAHDYAVPQFVLGNHGFLTDLSIPGTIGPILRALWSKSIDPAKQEAQVRMIYDRFSWDVLAPQYEQMLQHVAREVPPCLE